LTLRLSATRRNILAGAALASLAAPTRAASYSAGEFTHSVASGDPDANSVVLWTRFRASNGGNARIGWEVAEDEAFAKPAAKGELMIAAADDYCGKVLARGLKPGRRYFFRFLSASGASPTGLTRTAPQGKVDSLTFAAFSCSNLPWGYFHAYADAAARDEIELCLHLGDYIYEMQRGAYPSLDESVPGRTIFPAGETITYADYCARYASYRTDKDLQELHRLKPWSVIWDDHENANDAWVGGAGAHDPLKEGLWADRKAASIKAYFDWMPIRQVQKNGLRIYRRLDWGNLASLLMLDTRLIGRDQQVDLRKPLDAAALEGDAAFKATAEKIAKEQIADPKRTLLGATQEAWLSAQLRDSNRSGRPWQIIAQQVVMGRQLMPPESAKLLKTNPSEGQKKLVRNGLALTELDIPWNMDSWSGYPPARTRFLEACARDAANALVLAGDSHCAWAHNLPGGADGAPAAIEIGVTGVTSPGFERTFSNAGPGEREAVMVAANKELAWCDITNRGYNVTRLTAERTETTYVQLAHVASADRPGITTKTIAADARKGSGVGPWQV